MQKPSVVEERAKLNLNERRVLQAQDQICRQSICEQFGVQYWNEIATEQLRNLKPSSDTKRYVIEQRLLQNSRKKKPFLEPRFDRQQSFVQLVYTDSNAQKSRALYRKLEELGTEGLLAAYLLRVQKASDRAKMYGGAERGRFRHHAYDSKGKGLSEICDQLASLPFGWGWSVDKAQNRFPNVLYLDLPTGQVGALT